MTRLPVLWVLHVCMLLLATSRFTVISWLWSDWSFNIDYFQLSRRSGWGGQYVSDYSLAVVMTYIAAYLIGWLAFHESGRRPEVRIAGIGKLICLLGGASFIFELTHWFWSHYSSLICSLPIALLIVWVVAAIQYGGSKRVISATSSSAHGSSVQ